MKYVVAICAMLFTSLNPVWGQMVSSHAPTKSNVQQPPASPEMFQASNAPKVSDKPVARVNGVVLTERDLVREMYAIFPYARQHNGGFPASMEADIRAGALKMIIFEELVYQEAQRRHMTVPPARVDKAMAAFRKQFNSTAEYQDYLKQECAGSEKVLRTRIQRSILIDTLLKQEVQSKSVVTAAQAKAYYDKNPIRVGETFSIQTISFLAPDKATAAQRKELKRRAEEGLKQAKATKDYEQFGLLAEKISEDDYRVMMGDHKTVERDKLPPEIVNAALKMQPGQVSDLIQLGDSYTLFRLNAHNPAATIPFERAKDSLINNMQKQKTEQLRSSLDKKLRANAKVETL